MSMFDAQSARAIPRAVTLGLFLGGAVLGSASEASAQVQPDGVTVTPADPSLANPQYPGYPPTVYPPGTYPPPGTYAPGTYPPNTYPPGAYPPGTYAPNGYPPNGYQPGYNMYAPPRRTVLRYEERPRLGLIIGGAVTLGAVYLLHVTVTGFTQAFDCDVYNSSCSNATYWPNYIPVVGPWIMMGYVDPSYASLARLGLAFSGLAQGAGLAMLIVGAATRHRVPVYATVGKTRIDFAPSFLAGGGGLAAVGRF